MIDLNYVEALHRANTNTLGFIPRPRLEQYAARGQVLIAEENDDPAGFLVFGRGWPALRVYQACVQYDARRREHGARLVARLVTIAQRRGCHLISLWCADDLPANEFWAALGFRRVAQRVGGRRRGRALNRWVLPVSTDQLPLFKEGTE